jgi:hypothetical protein
LGCARLGVGGPGWNVWQPLWWSRRHLPSSLRFLSTVLETLARFRIDPKLAAELAAIEGEEDYFPLGEVPVEWLRQRILGIATASGEYADICSSEWISRLRKSLAIHLSRFGVEDIDASVLQKTAPRTLTQFVSRIVFYAGFSGIYYLSKYGHDIENWALFEPFQINVRDPETVSVEDRDLQLALRLHSLKFKE